MYLFMCLGHVAYAAAEGGWWLCSGHWRNTHRSRICWTLLQTCWCHHKVSVMFYINTQWTLTGCTLCQGSQELYGMFKILLKYQEKKLKYRNIFLLNGRSNYFHCSGNWEGFQINSDRISIRIFNLFFQYACINFFHSNPTFIKILCGPK